MFVEPCQAVGLFLFKWVLNVFLCFYPALNLESWYMEHYPWCWKRTGYQVEVSILNTAVKESSKRLPETGSMNTELVIPTEAGLHSCQKTSFACKKTDGTLAGHVSASAWYDDVMLWYYEDMITRWYDIIYKFPDVSRIFWKTAHIIKNSMSGGIQGVQTKHTFCTGKLHLLKEHMECCWCETLTALLESRLLGIHEADIRESGNNM